MAKVDSNAFKVAITQLPTWYTAQSAGTWKSLGTSWQAGLGAAPNTGGVEPNVGVFSYSGGCLNRAGFYEGASFLSGAAMLCWGGGHNAYSGNEICAFRLNEDAPKWRRVREAFPNAQYNTPRSADKSPASRHSYGGLCYVQSKNRLFSSDAGSIYSSNGVGAWLTDQFDFQVPSPNTNFPWINGPDIGTPNFFTDPNFAGTSVYDPVNDQVIHVLGGPYTVNVYSVAGGSWTRYPASGSAGVQSYSDRKTAAFSPTKQWMLIYSPDGFYALDCSNLASNVLVKVQSSGSGPPLDGQLGLTWDETNGRFVCGGYGNTLYYCTPPATISAAWTWTIAAPGGDMPAANPAIPGSGIWGRFAYVPAPLAGYVTIPWADAKPCFYKL